MLSISEKDDDKSLPCQSNPKIKSILYRLDDNIVEYLITNLFAGELQLFQYENKANMKRRIFIIYKSASENIKRSLKRSDILPFDEEDKLCKLDIPDTVKVKKDKTLRRKKGQRNQKCIEKEKNLMDQIRKGEKVTVDSMLINMLERCSDRGEDILISDKDEETTEKSLIEETTTGKEATTDEESDEEVMPITSFSSMLQEEASPIETTEVKEEGEEKVLPPVGEGVPFGEVVPVVPTVPVGEGEGEFTEKEDEGVPATELLKETPETPL